MVILRDQKKSDRLNRCRDVVGKTPMIDVHVLKGVYHGFDSRRNAPFDSLGNAIQYSTSATTKSEEITRAFLAKHLGK